MEVVGVVGTIIGLLGFAFGAKCYIELYKWARQCQHARIAISYKRKVKLQAPLVEWLAWVNQLDKDKDSHGRVIFNAGQVSVAIVKAVKPPGKVRSAIRQSRAAKGNSAPSRAAVKEGTWKPTDDTPKVSHLSQVTKGD